MRRKISNWANTFSCYPVYIQVDSEQEIIEIIETAVKNKKNIRVVGSAHSPSDLIMTNHLMINMDRLNRLIHVDEENKRITVEAGIKLWQLNELLQERGWAMPNLGSISEQSIAGLISTGSHGTGVEFGCLSTCITSIRMITTQGPLQLTKEDGDIFSAALCSLGCLGVITQVTIQVVDAFRIESTQRPILFNDMLSEFKDIAHSADHVRIWWFPKTENCTVWRGHRTQKPAIKRQENWYKDRFLGYYMLEASLFLSKFLPLNRYINQSHYNLFFSKPQKEIVDSVDAFNFDCLFSQYVTEWAVDIEQAPQMLKELKQVIDDHPEMAAHSPIEIRFVKKDDILLSMCHGRETCFIGIIIYRPFGFEIQKTEYWKSYEKIAKKFSGRPHWAKAHSLTPRQLSGLYPQFSRFLEIRQELDPHNVFVNDYIKRHLLVSKL